LFSASVTLPRFVPLNEKYKGGFERSPSYEARFPAEKNLLYGSDEQGTETWLDGFKNSA
jgi:hypothetical protein